MPWSRVVSFTDPFSYQSAFRSVDVELFPTVKGKFSAELTQVSMNKLRLQATVAQLAKTTPDILALAGVVHALEQELTLVMIRCLAEGEPSEMTAGGWRHDTIIGRFEEFLESHPDRPLYLTEICAAIG